MAAEKNTNRMALAVGTLVIGTVVLVACTILWWRPSGGGAFESNYAFIAMFDHVGALRAGAPIQLGGIRVGKVRAIDLTPDARSVSVICDVQHHISLPIDSTVHVATQGIVGDSFLEIKRGGKSEFLPKNPEPDPGVVLHSSGGGGLADVLDTVNTVGDNVTVLIRNLNDILGEEERKDLRATIANINSITANADLLLNDIIHITRGVNTSVRHINDATAKLPDIVADVNKAVGEATGVVEEIRAAADRILSDENIDTINGALASARRSVDNVRSATSRLDGILAAVPPEKVSELLDRASGAIDRVGPLADTLRGKVEAVDIDRVNAAIGHAGDALGRFSTIMSEVDPKDVGDAVKRVKAGLSDIQEFISGVRNDIVLALAVNKAADRIVETRFKEMKRDGVVSSERQLENIKQWVDGGMRRGYLPDPAYPDAGRAPYRSNLPSTGQDRRP